MSIDPIADAAVEGTFAALATPLTYQPRYGQPATVQAAPVSPPSALDALGGGRIAHDGLIVEIRAADLTQSPAEGDLVIVGQRRYRVRSARPADTARLVWQIEAVPC